MGFPVSFGAIGAMITLRLSAGDEVRLTATSIFGVHSTQPIAEPAQAACRRTRAWRARSQASRTTLADRVVPSMHCQEEAASRLNACLAKRTSSAHE